jgi:hypothetical protein
MPFVPERNRGKTRGPVAGIDGGVCAQRSRPVKQRIRAVMIVFIEL